MDRMGSRSRARWIASTFMAAASLAVPAFASGETLPPQRATFVSAIGGGKILVAGVTFPCDYRQASCGDAGVFVSRYRKDGSLDRGFGDGDGVVKLPVDNPVPGLSGLDLQRDGKIIVGADLPSLSSEEGAAVWRLRPNGTIDSTFGTGGRAVIPSGTFTSHGDADGLAVDSRDRIVLAGDVPSPEGEGPAAARLHPDGELDPSFGLGGVSTLDAGPDGSLRYATSVDIAGGRIALLGELIYPQFGGDLEFARLLDSGARDASFGTDGVTSIPFGESNINFSAGANAITRTSNGSLVSIGAVESGSRPCAVFELAKVDPTGAVVKSFGRNGVAETRTPDCEGGSDISKGGAKRLVATGSTYEGTSGGGERAVVARYKRNGALDRRFGDSGLFQRHVRNRASGTSALDVLGSRAVLAAGYVGEGRSRRPVLIKLTRGGKLQKRFGKDGVAEALPHGA